MSKAKVVTRVRLNRPFSNVRVLLAGSCDQSFKGSIDQPRCRGIRTDPRQPEDDRYCALEIRNQILGGRDEHGSGIKSDIHCLHMLKCMLLRPVLRSSYKGWRRIGREIIGTVIAKPHLRLVGITKIEKRAPHGLLVAANHSPLRIRMIYFQTVDKMRNLYPRSLTISLRNREIRGLTQDLQERGNR